MMMFNFYLYSHLLYLKFKKESSYDIYIGNGNYDINISNFKIEIRNGKTRNFIGSSRDEVFILYILFLLLQFF
jgi:hypothetical protein